MNKILESTKFVVDNSEFVKINQKKVSEFAKSFERTPTKHWIKDSSFDIYTLCDEDKLSFLLIFNSISFSYWGEPKWTITYKGKEYDGTWGAIMAIKRALKRHLPVLDFEFASNATKKANKDSQKLLQLAVDSFSLFKDVSQYKEKNSFL